MDLTALNLTSRACSSIPLAVSGPHRPHRPAAPPLPRRGSRRRPAASQRPRSAGARTRRCRASPTSRVPTSFTLTAGRAQANGRDIIDRDGVDNASLFVGMAPSAADRFLVFGAAANLEPGARTDRDARPISSKGGRTPRRCRRQRLEPQLRRPERPDGRRLRPSRPRPALHEYGQCSRSSPASSSAPATGPRNRIEGVSAALIHMIGFGDLTLRYGLEAQSGTQHLAAPSATPSSINIATQRVSSSSTPMTAHRHLSRARASTRTCSGAARTGSRRRPACSGHARHRGRRSGQRRGLAARRHRRLAFRGPMAARRLSQRRRPAPAFTLSPVTTVGLVPERAPVVARRPRPTRWRCAGTRNGRRTSSPRSSTSARTCEDLDLPIANTFDTLASARRGSTGSPPPPISGSARHRRVRHGRHDRRRRSAPSEASARRALHRRPLRPRRRHLRSPEPPEAHGRRDLCRRLTGNCSALALDDYWTTDAAITWETPDRRLLFGLTRPQPVRRRLRAGARHSAARGAPSPRRVKAQVLSMTAGRHAAPSRSAARTRPLRRHFVDRRAGLIAALPACPSCSSPPFRLVEARLFDILSDHRARRARRARAP